jgi:hypothetical protein
MVYSQEAVHEHKPASAAQQWFSDCVYLLCWTLPAVGSMCDLNDILNLALQVIGCSYTDDFYCILF